MTTELRDAIKQEHRRAEVKRLDEGWAGCGCGDCQALYRAIDLAKYGDRVIRFDNLIIVTEAKRPRRPDNATEGDDTGESGAAGGTPDVAKIQNKESMGETIMRHTDSDCAKDGDGLKHRGRPPKAGEVHRSTLWRRRRAGGR